MKIYKKYQKIAMALNIINIFIIECVFFLKHQFYNGFLLLFIPYFLFKFFSKITYMRHFATSKNTKYNLNHSILINFILYIAYCGICFYLISQQILIKNFKIPIIIELMMVYLLIMGFDQSIKNLIIINKNNIYNLFYEIELNQNTYAIKEKTKQGILLHIHDKKMQKITLCFEQNAIKDFIKKHKINVKDK